MTTSRVDGPSSLDRALGAAGIVGGAVLLAAFVIDIPGDVNTLRIVTFNVGAIAIALAIHRRLAALGVPLVLAIAAAAALANAWYLVMTLIALGRPVFPEPDPGFRLIGFYAGLAMSLTDAALGLVAWRSGVVTRLGSIALAIGSLLAILGMSHLELTSSAHPTVFGPLSLIGIALNGVGWTVLGLDVMLAGRAVPRLRSALAR
jgi:hypothetical protein